MFLPNKAEVLATTLYCIINGPTKMSKRNKRFLLAKDIHHEVPCNDCGVIFRCKVCKECDRIIDKYNENQDMIFQNIGNDTITTFTVKHSNYSDDQDDFPFRSGNKPTYRKYFDSQATNQLSSYEIYLKTVLWFEKIIKTWKEDFPFINKYLGKDVFPLLKGGVAEGIGLRKYVLSSTISKKQKEIWCSEIDELFAGGDNDTCVAINPELNNFDFIVETFKVSASKVLLDYTKDIEFFFRKLSNMRDITINGKTYKFIPRPRKNLEITPGSVKLFGQDKLIYYSRNDCISFDCNGNHAEFSLFRVKCSGFYYSEEHFAQTNKLLGVNVGVELFDCSLPTVSDQQLKDHFKHYKYWYNKVTPQDLLRLVI